MKTELTTQDHDGTTGTTGTTGNEERSDHQRKSKKRGNPRRKETQEGRKEILEKV